MKKIYNRNGFTMIELVLVIVVLGILAALAVPRMERDLRQEAADTILADIRYAQHMAINDYRENPRDNGWQKTFWQVKIEGCADNGIFISVGADKDKGGDISQSEAAIDPANGKPMFWRNTSNCEHGGDDTVSNSIFLYKQFGVNSISGSGGCAGVQHIGFDHLGRPHVSFSASATPDYSSYMQSECVFILKFKNDTQSVSIHIKPETGYAYIDEEDDS